MIDQEISTLVKNAEENAEKILANFRHQLDDIAKELLEKETISGKHMTNIINGIVEEEPDKKISKPKTTRRKSNKEA